MSFFSKSSPKGERYISEKYGVQVQPVVSDSNECLFSVYDIICGEYNPPFVCKNMATAIRNMKDSLKNATNSIIAMHPEDYELCQIGIFDKNNGLVETLEDTYRLRYPLSKLFESNSNVESVKLGDSNEISK